MNDTEIISSRDNAKLKLARAVRDGRERGLIFVEGVRLASECLRSDIRVNNVLCSESFLESSSFSELSELLPNKRLTPVKVASSIFDSIVDTESSQGIVILADRPVARIGDINVDDRHVVFLNRVNNPSNLGAVVRTAEAAGVAGLITSTGSADAFSPKALRASMGSSFRLPIVEGLEFDQVIEWAREEGLTSTAADISATKSYAEIDWSVPRLIVFGSEAHGLSEAELSGTDERIRIPMESGVESLNLAVSVGIILFEAKRRSKTAG